MASEDKAESGDRMLSTKEAAAKMGLQHRTLQDWRRKERKKGQQIGPPYTPVSARRVVYRESDVEAWLRARQVG